MRVGSPPLFFSLAVSSLPLRRIAILLVFVAVYLILSNTSAQYVDKQYIEPKMQIGFFDEGNLTKTVTTGADNQRKTKELTWDAWNRLVGVQETDSQNNGYNWSAVFDGFGRRLKTVYTPVVAGNPVTAKTQTISSYFDPNVEFLEIGVKVNEQAPTWKVYGVDKDETFGGLNGIGGLEAILTPKKTYHVINDALGHVVTTYDGTETKRVATQVGSYGPLPGSLALPLSAERGLHEVTHWLGKRIDETGYVHLGEREYHPANGSWISADPLGHFASWDLYSFANGNPISLTDPTGRLSKGMFQGAALGDNFTPENTAQGIGKVIGQVGMALVPYAGHVATMMGLAGDAQWDFTSSAGLTMAGGAFVPKPAVADVAKVMPHPYEGIQQASEYLQSMGVPRRQRVEWLQGFESGTVQVRTAGTNEFGIRYFDNSEAFAKGRWLFETFPASRESLALKPAWNQMTGFQQWQIRPGATIIEGNAAGQGLGLAGGAKQKFILNTNDLFRPQL